MDQQTTHTINLPSGEQQQVTPVKNMLGQVVGYDVFAITPTGDLRLVHSKVGEHYYQEKVEGGVLGGLSRAMKIDDRSIIDKYNREAHANNPTEALMRDRELYFYRDKNIKEMASKPDGLLWEPESGVIRRLDNYTAIKLLNENVSRAVKQGVFGKPNAQGLYSDPTDPSLPPIPLPQYSANNLSNPGNAGMNSAYANPDFFGVNTNGPNKGRAAFAGTKPKRFGRLFGASSNTNDGLMLDSSGLNSSAIGGAGSGFDSALEDILRSQMTKLGANPNITPNEPFFLSYAYRRSRPELNEQILSDEQCDMTVFELLTYYHNNELKDKQTVVSNFENTPELGVTMMIEDPATRVSFFAKQVNPNTWGGKEVDVVRRMISTGPYIQAFQGFAEDPKSKNFMAVFERPTMTILEYLRNQTLTDELFKRIFAIVLRGLCHLESIGLHHPELNDSSLKFVDGDLASLRLSNPFIYENYYQEIITVYLNSFNTVHGIAAFNKRYLQENIMELFCCLLSLVLRSNFSQYSPAVGQFNGPEIIKGLETVRRMCSPFVTDLLSRYLMTPIEKLPTPIMLANLEGISVDYNSYYGHSKINRPLYYPFEKFTGMKKLSSKQDKINPPPFAGRIPHWSEIDIYKDDDLNESRMMGIAHRKKNFVVEEGNVNNSVLKPYSITMREVEINENLLLAAHEASLGKKRAERYVPPKHEPEVENPQMGYRAPSPPAPAPQTPSSTFDQTKVIASGGNPSPNDSPLLGLSPILGPNNPAQARPEPVQARPEPVFVPQPVPDYKPPTGVIQGSRLESSQVLPIRLEESQSLVQQQPPLNRVGAEMQSRVMPQPQYQLQHQPQLQYQPQYHYHPQPQYQPQLQYHAQYQPQYQPLHHYQPQHQPQYTNVTYGDPRVVMVMHGVPNMRPSHNQITDQRYV